MKANVPLVTRQPFIMSIKKLNYCIICFIVYFWKSYMIINAGEAKWVQSLRLETEDKQLI